MRNAFARTMTELAQERDDVCLLSGDIGNRMFDRYKEVAPKRFLNCGIAEANMMSMAAGMGLSGLRPVVYTITPFTTTRCLEQIRIGVAYHEAPVVIVGTGSGLSYAELGATHHSLEDLALMRPIPGLNICVPADSIEVKMQLREAIKIGKPTYIRIGKKGEPQIHHNSENIKIGKGCIIEEGKQIMILGIGPIIQEALKARMQLKKEKIDIGVTSMGTVKPLDKELLNNIQRKGYRKFITLEEHYSIGGLGSAILEWAHEEKAGVEIKKIAIDDHFIHELGNQKYAREKENIDANSIVEAVRGIA